MMMKPARQYISLLEHWNVSEAYSLLTAPGRQAYFSLQSPCAGEWWFTQQEAAQPVKYNAVKCNGLLFSLSFFSVLMALR